MLKTKKKKTELHNFWSISKENELQTGKDRRNQDEDETVTHNKWRHKKERHPDTWIKLKSSGPEKLHLKY